MSIFNLELLRLRFEVFGVEVAREIRASSVSDSVIALVRILDQFHIYEFLQSVRNPDSAVIEIPCEYSRCKLHIGFIESFENPVVRLIHPRHPWSHVVSVTTRYITISECLLFVFGIGIV